MPQCASVPPILDRPPKRAFRYKNHTSIRSIFITQHGCLRPQRADHAPHRRQTIPSIASPPLGHPARCTQIPIAPAAQPHVPQRGFLPWRFSDAGPPSAPQRSSWAGIRKPSHSRPLRPLSHGDQGYRLDVELPAGLAKLPVIAMCCDMPSGRVRQSIGFHLLNPSAHALCAFGNSEIRGIQ